VKLNTYYSGLTAMAYARALVMNPFKKTAALRILWFQKPRKQAKKWLKDYLDKLKDTWAKRYRERKIESPIEELGTVDLGDLI
jgi:trehalose-6-phosphate synthase